MKIPNAPGFVDLQLAVATAVIGPQPTCRELGRE